MGKHDTEEMVDGRRSTVREPLRDFMKATRGPTRSRASSRSRSQQAGGESVGDADLVVLMPSFVVTELSESLCGGRRIYLPFLLLDLIVANVLLALA